MSDKHIGQYIVRKTQIAGTRITVFSAYEPSSEYGQHSTISTIGGAWYGQVNTKYTPTELTINLKSASNERFVAVRHWYSAQYELSYAIIFAAYPELVAMEHVKRDGYVEILESDPLPSTSL